MHLRRSSILCLNLIGGYWHCRRSEGDLRPSTCAFPRFPFFLIRLDPHKTLDDFIAAVSIYIKCSNEAVALHMEWWDSHQFQRFSWVSQISSPTANARISIQLTSQPLFLSAISCRQMNQILGRVAPGRANRECSRKDVLPTSCHRRCLRFLGVIGVLSVSVGADCRRDRWPINTESVLSNPYVTHPRHYIPSPMASEDGWNSTKHCTLIPPFFALRIVLKATNKSFREIHPFHVSMSPSYTS